MSTISGNTRTTPEQDISSDLQPEATRANLYYLLAEAFSSPLNMPKELPQQWRTLIPELPEAWRDAAVAVAGTWEEGLEHPEPLALAYAQHFLGPFETLSPPYASFYLEQDHRLVGDVSRWVAGFYAEAGLEPGRHAREAPDHVALEWEFMYYLTFQYATTGESRWIEQRENFLTNHLMQWLPQLRAAMAQHAAHPFYAALARFLELMMQPQ